MLEVNRQGDRGPVWSKVLKHLLVNVVWKPIAVQLRAPVGRQAGPSLFSGAENEQVNRPRPVKTTG